MEIGKAILLNARLCARGLGRRVRIIAQIRAYRHPIPHLSLRRGDVVGADRVTALLRPGDMDVMKDGWQHRAYLISISIRTLNRTIRPGISHATLTDAVRGRRLRSLTANRQAPPGRDLIQDRIQGRLLQRRDPVRQGFRNGIRVAQSLDANW